MSPLQTKPVNKCSYSNSLCYTKPNHFTHVLFSQCSSCLKQYQTRPNVPPCRLCKSNDSINMFYVAIPNQIILHTCYSSHCNSMWKCQTKPHNLQQYMVPWYKWHLLKLSDTHQCLLVRWFQSINYSGHCLALLLIDCC